MSDLIISSGLDQPIPTDNEWALHRIEEIVQDALDKKDPHIILDALRQLVQLSKMSGLALAKGLYMVSRYWYEFDSGDEFSDVCFDYTGLHKYTIERYVGVWSMLENDVPAEHKEELMQRNIKDLIPVANAVGQGFELTEDQWVEIVRSPDFASVSKVIREDVKNASPRKGQLTLQLKRDGTIMAYMDGEEERCAWVDTTSRKKVVQKAVNRLLDSAGVLKL